MHEAPPGLARRIDKCLARIAATAPIVGDDCRIHRPGEFLSNDAIFDHPSIMPGSGGFGQTAA
jgi:hypothetical protein